MRATLDGDELTYTCDVCGEPATRLVMLPSSRWASMCGGDCLPPHVRPTAELPVHEFASLGYLLTATAVYRQQWSRR